MVPRSNLAKTVFLGISALIIIGVFINFYATGFYAVLAYCMSGPILSLTKFLT